MGKILLLYVLYFVVAGAGATADMVKKENASKLLSDLSVTCSSLNIILIMVIFCTVIITGTKRVLSIVGYKLQDLCSTYRQMYVTSELKLVAMLLLIYAQVFREVDKMHLNIAIQH